MSQLPKLTGDIMLDVFTHKSLVYGSAPDKEYDNERLALLGKTAIDMAATYVLFLQKPVLSSDDIVKIRNETLTHDNIETWVRSNGLLNKLRYAPTEIDRVKSPEEIVFLLHSYVGALYVQSGMAPIQEWMACIISPNNQPASSSSLPPAYQYGNDVYAPPPSASPPPLPATQGKGSASASATTTATTSAVTLSLVNQTATQKSCQILYSAESSGPAHQPTWVIKCSINGVEKGRGTGKNQKVAKEEAARQAFFAMGWNS